MIKKTDGDEDAFLTSNYEAERELAENKIGRVNILVVGNTGVGKSTLINSVFGEDVAKAGTGQPVTEHLERYEVPHSPLCLFDTRGFEAASLDAFKSIKQKLDSLCKDPSPSEHIHVAWLCIASTSDRVEPVHQQFLQILDSLGIPCIVVLTKSATTSMLDEAQALARPSAAVVEVLAADQPTRSGGVEAAFGLDELVEITSSLIPAGFRTAFAAAQKASWPLKKAAARKVVAAASVASGASAGIPVPGGHSASLLVIQTGMMASIDVIYGIDPVLSATNLIRAGALKAAASGGRWAFALALTEGAKLIPGIGTAGGMVAGGVVGSTVTAAVGSAYIEGLSRYLEAGYDVPSAELGDALKSAIANSLDKQAA